MKHFKRFSKIIRTHISSILNIATFLVAVILVAMFIQFNATVAENAREAKDNTMATRQLVTKQDETLTAIKSLAQDNKLTSKQLGDTIICMLQVPIEQRTTDVQEACRRAATSSTVSSGGGTTQNFVNTGSSPKSTPPAPSVQHDNVQSSNDTNHSIVQRVGRSIMNTVRSVTNFIKGNL